LPQLAELQRLILIRFFQSNLEFDEVQTEAARERARAAVDPVKGTVLQGERIVGAHEQIGEQEEERLRAYQAELTRRGQDAVGEQATLARALGAVMYNALVLALFGALLFFFRRKLYGEWRSLLLFAVLVVLVAAAGAAIARFEMPPELIPVTFAALIVAVLWDGRLGLCWRWCSRS
jgi:cyclic-di-AMP phosphodiesterase PgpH